MQNMQNILRNIHRASRLYRTTRLPPTRYPPSGEGGILVTPVLVGWAGIAFLYWIDFKGIRTMHKARRENLKRNLEMLEEESERRLEMMKTEEAQQRARKWEETRAMLREWEIKMKAEEAKQRARVANDDNVNGFWINDDNVGPKDDCQFAM